MGKGDQWERDISRDLSLWWTGGEEDDVFWRVRASGGRATQRKKQGKDTTNQEGDIMAVDERGLPLTSQVVIELKKGYNDCDLFPCIDKLTGKQNPIIIKFLEQVVSSCSAEANGLIKRPILILKRDRKKTIIGMDYEFFDQFVSHTSLFHYHIIDLHLYHVLNTNDAFDFTFMEFNAFKEYCNPKQIKEHYKNGNGSTRENS